MNPDLEELLQAVKKGPNTDRYKRFEGRQAVRNLDKLITHHLDIVIALRQIRKELARQHKIFTGRDI